MGNTAWSRKNRQRKREAAASSKASSEMSGSDSVRTYGMNSFDEFESGHDVRGIRKRRKK